jgi:hypothetical protein
VGERRIEMTKKEDGTSSTKGSSSCCAGKHYERRVAADSDGESDSAKGFVLDMQTLMARGYAEAHSRRVKAGIAEAKHRKALANKAQ